MAHPLDLLHLGIGGEAALAVYIFPLVLAGISDFRTLRIPNYLTIALAAAFPLAALAAGQHVDWLSHIEAGLLVFAGGAVLFDERRFQDCVRHIHVHSGARLALATVYLNRQPRPGTARAGLD